MAEGASRRFLDGEIIACYRDRFGICISGNRVVYAERVGPGEPVVEVHVVPLATWARNGFVWSAQALNRHARLSLIEVAGRARTIAEGTVRRVPIPAGVDDGSEAFVRFVAINGNADGTSMMAGAVPSCPYVVIGTTLGLYVGGPTGAAIGAGAGLLLDWWRSRPPSS